MLVIAQLALKAKMQSCTFDQNRVQDRICIFDVLLYKHAIKMRNAQNGGKNQTARLARGFNGLM